MNDEQAVRSAGASVIGELSAALRQAIAQMRADDATARRSADERTASHLTQIDRRLEELSTRLAPPSSSSPATTSRRFDGSFLAPTVTVIAFVVAVPLAGAIGGKLVGCVRRQIHDLESTGKAIFAAWNAMHGTAKS